MHWDFCYVYLTQNVFAFLKNEENIIDSDEVILVHEKAPCMQANKTLHLLEDNDVKLWSNYIWSGNSLDLAGEGEEKSDYHLHYQDSSYHCK